jgi:hypothetical protein
METRQDDWVTFAQSLPEGTHRKYQHGCGSGEPRIVNHKREGYSWNCFRCGEKGWKAKPAESLTGRLERLRRVASVEREATRTQTPPAGDKDPRNWPLAARVWLYTAGISNVEIEALGIVWSERLQRVVLPVVDSGGACIYWQARSLDKTNPRKYLNPPVDKSCLVAKFGSGPVVVLTEDLLSAYRVSRAGVEAWCLLGTKLSTHVASQIITDGRPVACWLDPDSAGKTAAAKVCKTLRAYGVKVTNVISDRDPKLLPREEIIWTLQKQCGLPA